MTSRPGGADTSWRDFERAGWESRAQPYHQFFAALCSQLADPLLDAVRAGAGTRLLDACCGPGYVAGRAVERGSVVQGIDIAASMVELAASLYPEARFRVGDAEEMPYADDDFDGVVCNIGVHHVTTPVRAVAEFSRVLRPSGRLALSIWDEERSAFGVVPEAIIAAGAVAPEDLPTPPQDSLNEGAEALVELLLEAGLTVESVEPITLVQPFAGAQSLWDGWLAAAIRTGPLLAAQSAAVRAAARRSLDDLVAPYLQADGALALPVGFIIATATV